VSQPPPLADAAAREAASTRLDRSAFIEAGAGTGKSSTLVDRVLHTVQSDRGVPISGIAAITFTERAGARLRDDIRRRLTAVLDKEPGNDAVREALRQLDAAMIGTIHSFAQRILRTHALAAGLPLGFEVLTGSAAAEDTQDRIRRAVEHVDAALQPGDRGALESAGIEAIDLRPLITGLDSGWLRLSSAAPAAEVDVEALCRPVAEALQDFLDRARADCADPDHDRLMSLFEERIPPAVALLLRADPDELLSALDDAEIQETFKTRTAGSAAAWGSRDDVTARRDEYRSLKPAFDAALRVRIEIAVRRSLALAWQALSDHRDKRAREGLVSFDQLLLLARNLLHADRDVRVHLHEQYPVIMVDEFQDTDPVQWELVRRIAADPDDFDAVPLPGRMIVVGDPKQAIYSFRGADVGTYRDAQASATSGSAPWGDLHGLVTNFRTVRPVIDWVNEVFSATMGAQVDQVDYSPLDAHHDPSHPSPGPAVTVVRDPEPDPADADGIDSRSLEAALLVQEIARAVRDGWQVTERREDQTRAYARSADYADVAVLYPTRNCVPGLLDALDDAGVPYRSTDAGLVLERPVIVGLLAALAVIDDPSRELDVWVALKSPLFGCSDADLVRHRRAGGNWRLPGVDAVLPDTRVATALALLGGIRAASDAPRPTLVIDELVERTRVLEVLGFVPRGDFDGDCVRMLRAHAQQFEDNGGVGLPDYLFGVRDLLSEGNLGTLPEPDVRDDDAVRLMTIHQAKGLEFPIVVLAGMATFIYDPAPTIGVVGPDWFEFTSSRITSAGYPDWNATVRRPRQDAERTRQLYVACTRARDHLIVSMCGEHRSGRRDDRRPWSVLLAEAVPHAADDISDIDATVAARAPRTRATAPALPMDWEQAVIDIRTRSARPHVLSPSGDGARALGIALTSSPATDLHGEPTTPARAGEASVAAEARAARDGRPRGRAVHAALDALLSSHATLTDEDVARACLRAATEEGIAHEVDSVSLRVGAAWDSPVLIEARSATRRWTEVYLAAPTDDDVLVEGFADLVFESTDGLVVVDYKTDEVLTPEVRAHYDEQLAAYAELISRSTGLAVARRVILHLDGEGRASAYDSVL
jgi:ATP-dependent exoDNAse (exonuclease V) beta subunit